MIYVPKLHSLEQKDVYSGRVGAEEKDFINNPGYKIKHDGDDASGILTNVCVAVAKIGESV